MWADDWDRLTPGQQEAALDLLADWDGLTPAQQEAQQEAALDLDWDDRPERADDDTPCGCYACTGSGTPPTHNLSDDEWADAGKPQRFRPIINVELPEPGELT